MRVADYSFARPSPAALAANFVGVMRYLGYGSKVLTPGERDNLFRAGLDVGLVWETTATRMNGGYAAGYADAGTANAQADGLSYPAGRPIYFANDQNAATGAHVEYMRGARDGSKRPVGPYGSTALVDAAAGLGCRYGWKVQTWGPPTSNANLQQMPNIATPVPGTDVNDTLKADWGQWSGTAAPEEDVMKGYFAKTADSPTVWYVFGNSKSWVQTPDVLGVIAFLGHSQNNASNIYVLTHAQLDPIPIVPMPGPAGPGGGASATAVADELAKRLAA